MLLLSPADKQDCDTKMGQPGKENSGRSTAESVGKTEKTIWRAVDGFTSRIWGNSTQVQEPSCMMKESGHKELPQRTRAKSVQGQGATPPRKQVGQGEGWLSEPGSLGESHLLFSEPAELFLRWQRAE